MSASSLDARELKYANRLAEFLIQQPELFRTIAERYRDKRWNFNKPWQLRDFIEANYGIQDFDLLEHLPDSVENYYIFNVFLIGYDMLGDNKKPVADPSYEWINHPSLNKSYIASQMGLTPQTFIKKLKELGSNQFSYEEIIKLAHVREQLIEELRPSASPLT